MKQFRCGPEVHTSKWGTLMAETVKEWLAQPRKRLARGKEMNASKRVDVGVQVENATYAQEDMDQESEPEEHEAPFQTENDDHERLHNVEAELATAVRLLKLPEDSDSENSGDSDFEYDYV